MAKPPKLPRPRNPVAPKAHRSGAGAHKSPRDYRRASAKTAIAEQMETAETPRQERRFLPMYHLVPEEIFRRIPRDEPYVSETFYDEGFIHLTDPEEEIVNVGNRYYRADPRSYLVLDVDRRRVTAPLKYEDPAKIFPHVHGPLNRDAIVRVRRFRRGADGTFLGPGEDLTGQD